MNIRPTTHAPALRFQGSGGMWEWYYDALQAALVLNLQEVTKVREPQMSVQLQALPTP